jgi:hypothetical protein
MVTDCGGAGPAAHMNRRQFFAIVAAAAQLTAVRAGYADCGEVSSADFVQAVYQRQIELRAADTPLDDDTYSALFSRNLRKLMHSPRPYLRNEPIGRILNAFFGWGVLPTLAVQVDKVAQVSGRAEGPATVGVDIRYLGEKHRVLVRVVREREIWRIADISYDSGKSLVKHYRRITGR